MIAAGPVRTTFALWPRQPGLQFPKAKRVYHIGRGRVNRKPELSNVANVKMLPIPNVDNFSKHGLQMIDFSRR